MEYSNRSTKDCVSVVVPGQRAPAGAPWAVPGQRAPSGASWAAGSACAGRRVVGGGGSACAGSRLVGGVGEHEDRALAARVGLLAMLDDVHAECLLVFARAQRHQEPDHA